MSEYLHADAEAHARVKHYVLVFLALLVLTLVTVEAARHDFGAWNNVLALAIAFTKASLVIAFFMHARWAGKLVVLVVGSAFVFLGILFLFTMSDYVSRAWPLVAG
jgi:cytochrome c oxidase subunit 4